MCVSAMCHVLYDKSMTSWHSVCTEYTHACFIERMNYSAGVISLHLGVLQQSGLHSCFGSMPCQLVEGEVRATLSMYVCLPCVTCCMTNTHYRMRVQTLHIERGCGGQGYATLTPCEYRREWEACCACVAVDVEELLLCLSGHDPPLWLVLSKG